MRHGMKITTVISGLMMVLCAYAMGQGAGNSFIQGLAPDWEQPLDYPDPPGFDPTGPMPLDPFWNAWCAPTAAAGLIGYWEDEKNRAGLADISADGNQSKIPPGYQGKPWGAGPTWHDYAADGIKGIPGPNPLRGARPVDDLGVYMDTNGHMTGFVHAGTFYKDVDAGLNSFFHAAGKGPGQPAEGLTAVTRGVSPFFGAWTQQQMVAALKTEIDGNRPAIAHFMHWNILLNGPPANPGTGEETEEEDFEVEKYVFGDWIPGGCHGETWNGYEGDMGLGHAVLVVGYTRNLLGAVTHLIVHDNWPVTRRNVQVPVGPQLAAVTLVRLAGNCYVKGLAPDWNQPPAYPDLFDPSGPVAGDPFWNAWCVPTAAACLIGHWEDEKGRAGLADGSADGNPFKIPPGYQGKPWGGGPTWHDYTADGFKGVAGPHPKRGQRPVDDLGVYLDTNGHITGWLHKGTFYKDVAPGLHQFFKAVNQLPGKPARLLNAKTWGVHPMFGGVPLGRLVDILKFEVDHNRTVIAHFKHWNILPNGPPANPGTGDETSESQFETEEYVFGEWVPGGCHEEEWNGYEGELGLGHAVLVVGYTQDIWGNVTHLIVHDNWFVTGRNVQVPAGPQLAAINTVRGIFEVQPKAHP